MQQALLLFSFSASVSLLFEVDPAEHDCVDYIERRQDVGRGRNESSTLRKDQSSHRKKKRRTGKAKRKEERRGWNARIRATGKFGSFLIEFPSLS